MQVSTPMIEFEDVVRDVTPIALGYLVRRCQPREDAADLWQQVLTTAWRRFADLPQGPEARVAWFVSTARHELSHHHRAALRREAATIRMAQQLASQTQEACRVDLSDLLDRLTTKDREVVELTYWEGLTSEQVGQVMQMSAASVRKRLQRSREVLRQSMVSS